MLVGPDGRLVKDDPQENGGWQSYGVPVLAVADAVVVDVADGIAENVPLSEERAVPNKRETMTGNYVVLELAPDRFALYAHLKPGSLLVRVGDRVRAGQELGRIGNSGNSDAPHLHFHLANSPDPLSGEGVPFAFTSFAVLDRVDVAFWGGMLVEHTPWEPTTGLEPALCEAEMPLGEAIIEFR
jgi:murein DD-endopeptidase MepM/ murein hydrolase activator NlpD